MSCTPNTLAGITLECGNVGGLSVAYLIDTQNVSSVAIVDGAVTGITLVTGTTFKTFNFRKNNGNFSSAGTRSDENGTLFYTTTTELKFNYMETAKRNEMEKLASGNYYMIVKDNNSKYWLIGYSTLNTYIYGNVTANSGAAMTDANQYILSLVTDTPALPFEVNSSIIAAIIS